MSLKSLRSAALRRCDRVLNANKAARRRWSLWVPGRIEILGKHTDYAGGRSIVCAVDRGFAVRLAPRRDALVRVFSAIDGGTFETPLTEASGGDGGQWTQYVGTAVRRIARDVPRARRGVDIAFESDLPIAAGLSSSSALLISVFSALDKVNGIQRRTEFRRAVPTPLALAQYLSAVENGYPYGSWRGDSGVGTLAGMQDQVAILCTQPNELSRFRWSPASLEGTLPMPKGHVFVVAASGVAAAKNAGARSRYNQAAQTVHRLLSQWNTRTGRHDATLYEAIMSGPAATSGLRAIAAESRDAVFTAPVLTARLEQFVRETTEIIPAAWDALARGDLPAFGFLVDESQSLAETGLANQIPETVGLQRFARTLGAVAASAFGAGFGGSVWALVDARSAPRFLARWREAYVNAFPAHRSSAQFFTTGAGSALTWL